MLASPLGFSHHLITLSALSSMLRNRRTNLLRRFQIDHQLELLVRSTGRSAGFVPFRILST